jgi:hypothetical protein
VASNIPGFNIRNADSTVAFLKAFDTDASKALAKGLRKALRPIAKAAQEQVPDPPLSQWERYGWIDRKGRRDRDLKWDTAKVKRGIQVLIGGKRQRGRIVSNLAGIRNANAAGAIYELAGSKTPGNQLDKSLGFSGHGAAPRLVLKQDTTENRRRVEREITAVMQEAERALQRRLDRMV